MVNIQKLFKEQLTKKQISLVPRSFDVVGDLLIFSGFPEGLEKKEKIIGEILLKNFKNINVVLKKSKKFSGKYRLPKYKILAGARRKKTIHKESGCQFKLHIEKTYFSSRLSTERLRIASQVKTGEQILVMFSGCAPYPIVISKNSNPKIIYGIEMNPDAHKYALENLRLNKINNVKLYCGDVKKILPKLKKKFDRIVMPLPKTGEEFLPLALKYIKKSGTIHYYTFSHEDEINKVKKIIKNICKESKKKCTMKKIVKCGQYSPRVYRICIDLWI